MSPSINQWLIIASTQKNIYIYTFQNPWSGSSLLFNFNHPLIDHLSNGSRCIHNSNNQKEIDGPYPYTWHMMAMITNFSSNRVRRDTQNFYLVWHEGLPCNFQFFSLSVELTQLTLSLSISEKKSTKRLRQAPSWGYGIEIAIHFCPLLCLPFAFISQNRHFSALFFPYHKWFSTYQSLEPLFCFFYPSHTSEIGPI